MVGIPIGAAIRQQLWLVVITRVVTTRAVISGVVPGISACSTA
ncbi:hypothetical protein [Streptomyces sp. NPDC059080]